MIAKPAAYLNSFTVELICSAVTLVGRPDNATGRLLCDAASMICLFTSISASCKPNKNK